MHANRDQHAKHCVFLSDTRLTIDDADKEPFGPGKRLATLLDVIMDRGFIETNKGTEFLVRWLNSPAQKDSDWYYVDRVTGSIIAVGRDRIDALEWHEKIAVHHTAYDAAAKGKPVILGIQAYTTDDDIFGQLFLFGEEIGDDFFNGKAKAAIRDG